MSMIVWILLGLGLIASKIVSTTGEGTVVDILLGIVGAVVGGWLEENVVERQKDDSADDGGTRAVNGGCGRAACFI
jgi:uncharacterized membrane protein YeaQ/YmgE (transglycosylase-associated protein family)